MSPKTRGYLAGKERLRRHAPVFAALGDATRLALVVTLTQTPLCSISQLAGGTKMTRQAITKHLGVLESAGLVRSENAGRERLFELKPDALAEIREYLELVSKQWEEALSRLQKFVEES